MLTKSKEQLFQLTSVLGEEINASTIRVVIYVSSIKKLDNFGQQSKRAS